MDAESLGIEYGDLHRESSGKKPSFSQYRILTDILNSGEEAYSFLPTVLPVNRINYADLVFTLTKNPEQYVRPVVDLENYGYIVKGNNIFFRAGKEAGIKSFICDVNRDALLDKHFSQFQLQEPTIPYSALSVHAVLFLDILKQEDLKRDVEQEYLTNEVLYRSRFERVYNFGLDIKFHPEQEAIEYKIPKTGSQLFRDIYLKGAEHKNMSGVINDYKEHYSEFMEKNRISAQELKKTEEEVQFDNQEIERDNCMIVSLLYSAVKKYGKIRSINGIISNL